MTYRDAIRVGLSIERAEELLDAHNFRRFLHLWQWSAARFSSLEDPRGDAIYASSQARYWRLRDKAQGHVRRILAR